MFTHPKNISAWHMSDSIYEINDMREQYRLGPIPAFPSESPFITIFVTQIAVGVNFSSCSNSSGQA
jgi:hypothetical protein